MVKVEESPGSSEVVARFLADTKDELDQAILAYLKDYPYAGYMTHEVATPYEKYTDDGKLVAKYWRLASCD